MTGVDGPLKDAAEQVLTLKPNFSYTLQEVSDDCAHIFELGWFKKCHPSAEDTRDGIKLTIQVQTRRCSSFKLLLKPYPYLSYLASWLKMPSTLCPPEANCTCKQSSSLSGSNSWDVVEWLQQLPLQKLCAACSQLIPACKADMFCSIKVPKS